MHSAELDEQTHQHIRAYSTHACRACPVMRASSATPTHHTAPYRRRTILQTQLRWAPGAPPESHRRRNL